MNNISNNFSSLIPQRRTINDLNELIELLSKYQKLKEKYDSLSKIDRYMILDELNSLENILTYGIEIDNRLIEEYILKVLGLTEELGINTEVVKSKIKNIKLTVSPVRALSKGKLCNYGDFISVDYSYALFDSNGKFFGWNEPNPNFLLHALIHELLHSISNKGFNYSDSFSEGLTDYFAHKISKATNMVSELYGYFEKIFYMFGIMMGDDLLFEDYVTDIYKMDNLVKLTSSLGIVEEEFKKFKNKCDKLLKEKSKKTKNMDEINNLEEELNDFILNRIILPYCSFDMEKAIQMFQRIFGNSEYIMSDIFNIKLSEEQSNSKAIN